MKTMIKTSLKLILRSKLLWLFMILAPVLSVVILKSKTEYTAFAESPEEIVELKNAEEKIAYNSGKGEYTVKVYDASAGALSDKLLNELVSSGMFVICRANISSVADADAFVAERIKTDAFEDRMGAALYIPSGFDEKILNGDANNAVRAYVLSDDKREDALIAEIDLQLSTMSGIAELCKAYGADDLDAAGLLEKIREAEENMPEKQKLTVAGGGSSLLTHEQNNQKAKMGYAFVFMTLASVFCGFFVAYTSITEQKNGVLTRIGLSKTSMLEYFGSKIATVFIISLMLTAVEAACSFTLNMEDLGMERGKFILMIFLMGLIFSEISMFVGTIMGEVMSASMASFSIWIVSALLSGCYFPIEYSSVALKTLSYMMPQKWFLDGTEKLLTGDSGVLTVLLCVTASYVIATLSLGSLGLKVRKS
ncbi:MAG: ABC transporter permease [Lachnospiraceae bacterium]|nr:ABC transporter permease [Lachnospiraceae bacterium]